MPRTCLPLLVLALAGLSWPGSPARAGQAVPPDLVSILPEDFGLCLVVRDLRGQYQHLERSGWVKEFRQSALGRALLEAPEWQQFARFQRELKRAVEVDWATLRDEILGEQVVLAYRPGAPDRPQDEQGLVLVRARQADLLARLVQRMNDIQQRGGEVGAITPVPYKGLTYYRRPAKGKDQFYLLDGTLLVVAGKEGTIRAVIDRLRQPAGAADGWAQKFRRAGADRAFLALCVNPRALEPDFVQGAKKDSAARGYWQALDALFLAVRPGDALEVRLSVQARADQLPSWLRPAFLDTPPPSALWQRFPDGAVVTVATRADVGESLTALVELLPKKERQQLTDGLQRSLGAVTGLDVFADILPNLGPDWGVCVLPPADAGQVPQALVALAVRPGAKRVAVDQALYKAAHLFAALAVLDYNKKHPDAIRLQTTDQDKVEVKYLSNDKAFPAGFRPACALKDGFLLLATSPAAIRAFGAGPRAAQEPDGETPVVRVSAQALARVLDGRREFIVQDLVKKQNQTPAAAQRNLTNLIESLQLLDRAVISRRGEPGQAQWILRIDPGPQRPAQ